MSQNALVLPFSDQIVGNQKKFNEDLGREIDWYLVDLKLNQIYPNPYNNRFAPDEALSDDDHRKLIIEEDILAYEHLRKSLAANPQLEPLTAYIASGEKKVRLIGGHRRFYAAKDESLESFLTWVTYDLTPEEIEHIRDWPEIHQTKVHHSPFSKAKAIHDDLKNRNELDREKRIAIWKQKGYTRQQILKGERVFGRVKAFCDSNSERPTQRAGQIKAFETYDNLAENTFSDLRDQGDFEKVVVLDKVARAFLKNNIAHDDLKVAVEGLAELPKSDPLYAQIKNEDFLKDEVNLRKITNTIRHVKDEGDIGENVKNFTSRIFSKLVEKADEGEIKNVITELQDTVSRLESVLATLQPGGAQ